jgi:hypothetical protein
MFLQLLNIYVNKVIKNNNDNKNDNKNDDNNNKSEI